MRTSKINSLTNLVFRNSQQRININEQVFQLTDEREGQRGQSRQQQKEKQNNQSDHTSNQMKILKRTSKKLFIKGMQSDAESVAVMQNNLLHRSMRVNSLILKSRLSAYRTSI